MTPLEIKSARKKLGMSCDEFGKALGLDGENRKVTVMRWECGMRSPSGAVIKLINLLLSDHNKASG